MTVDLTGPLYEILKKKQQEFNSAKENGNDAEAQRKALEVASVLRKIAKSSTQKKQLEEQARKWEYLGNGNAPLRPEDPKPYQKPIRAKSGSSESEDEDFSSQADSLISKSSVRWGDIGGLETVKMLMMETVVIAGLQRPESIKPWKGILLFGPPGTGKTLIAAAAAGSLNATFYDVKSDKVLSKYFGESSKLISSLYNSARSRAPSIVFVDEFDALCQSRDSDASEASRKVLSSLLTELDGLSDKKSTQLLLTLAATNTPWDMDTAVLSRFPRRIYVTLPDEKACSDIIKIQMKGLDISSIDIHSLALKCVNALYSGRDLGNFCQLATWTMIHDANPDLHKLADLPFDELQNRKLKTKPLEMKDFSEAFEKIHSPLTLDTLKRYEEWNKEFGEK